MEQVKCIPINVNRTLTGFRAKGIAMPTLTSLTKGTLEIHSKWNLWRFDDRGTGLVWEYKMDRPWLRFVCRHKKRGLFHRWSKWEYAGSMELG